MTETAAPPRTKLICPSCGSDRLYSSEEATIDYPILVHQGDKQRIDYEYDIERDRQVNDESTRFQDDVYCKECSNETNLAGLLTERQFAHRFEPPGDVINVDEDSDRGADVRFQGVCYAKHGGYECGWCSPWEHADSYDDGLSSHPPEGERPDPAQLAWNAAEQAAKDHLRSEGVTDLAD